MDTTPKAFRRKGRTWKRPCKGQDCKDVEFQGPLELASDVSWSYLKAFRIGFDCHKNRESQAIGNGASYPAHAVADLLGVGVHLHLCGMRVAHTTEST
eukprot:2515763-Amphidinium_carterae.2